MVTPKPVHGIRAWVSAPLDPQVQSGDVSGWIGVGRPHAAGKRGVLRVGLLASAGGSLQLYYERQLRLGVWQRFLGPTVVAGERHKVSLLEMPHRRTFWRVWIDGHVVSKPIHMTLARRGKYALATGESWDGGTSVCNSIDYFFGPVTVRGSRWTRLRSRQVVQDPGYAVVRRAPGVFNATTEADASNFYGDWETGDASQWTANHWNQSFPLSDQFQVVTDPVRQGRYAAKFTVRPGDKYGTTSGERSEVLWLGSSESDGQDYWYSWSTLFPETWTEPKGWGIFVQWHSFNWTTPAIAFNARKDSVIVNVDGGPLNSAGTTGSVRNVFPLLASLNKGKWNDFIAHIKFSSVNEGAITVWNRVEGDSAYTKVLDVSGFPTLQSKDGFVQKNYLVHGLYRGDDTKTDVIYQDGFHRWSSPDPPPEVAGTP